MESKKGDLTLSLMSSVWDEDSMLNGIFVWVTKCSSSRKGKKALGAQISFALIIQNVAFHSQWCKYIALVRNQGEQELQSRSKPAGIRGEEKQKLCCIRYWRTSKYFYSLLLFLCEREQPSRLGWLALGRDFGKFQSKSMFECMCVRMCSRCLHEVQNVQVFICYSSHLCSTPSCQCNKPFIQSHDIQLPSLLIFLDRNSLDRPYFNQNPCKNTKLSD